MSTVELTITIFSTQCSPNRHEFDVFDVNFCVAKLGKDEEALTCEKWRSGFSCFNFFSAAAISCTVTGWWRRCMQTDKLETSFIDCIPGHCMES